MITNSCQVNSLFSKMMLWLLKLCFFLKVYILFRFSYFCRIFHDQVKNCSKSYDWRNCLVCCLPGNWKCVHLKLISGAWPGHWGTLHLFSSRTCGISFSILFVHVLSSWHTPGRFAAFGKTMNFKKTLFLITIFWLCDDYTKMSTHYTGSQSFDSSAFAF